MIDHDIKWGKGKLKYDNGDAYVGLFANDEFCGQGKFTDHFGNIYDGTWDCGE